MLLKMILNKMDVRNTKQKELLWQQIQNLESFFHADELLRKVQKVNSKVGQATVYRFLKRLVAEGKVHSYQCNRKTIYSTTDKNHSHFTCEVCGKVSHITIKKLDFLRQVVSGSVCHFQLDVTGVCQKCLDKD